MKRALCIFLSFALIFVFCSCGSTKPVSKVFGQEVTIVKLPSPPKCKTSNSVTVVNEVLNVLGLIEKHPIPNETDENGGLSTMIRIKIDGQEFVYTLGGDLFTDSNGKQYNISNCEEIENKITDIYNELDAQEKDYP